MYTQSAEQDFDLSFLEEIADGNKEFLIESIDMFLVQTPDIFGNISQAIVSQDWVTTASLAHKVKSNLGFFGMERIKGEIQEIEINAKAGGTDPLLQTKFEAIKTAVAKSLEQLTQIKKQIEAEA
ncbi:MAG: Hpt domain-containing protein [Sphingobacteriaceae bacterium]|nr:MAG: Hpt domain-containing protein [Sphingobacteriaceae bacterium]